MLTGYVTFIRAHETILAMVLAAATIFGAWGHIEAIIQRHDASHEVQAQIVATAQAQKDVALAAQVATDKASFDALQAQIQVKDAALIQVNAALVAALTKQQKVDASLPIPELANRWTALVPSAKPQATPTGVTLDSAGAIATVQQLELIPTLQTELTNTQTLVSNGNSLVIAETKQVSDLNAEVAGLNLKAIDDKNVCIAEIKVVKDAASKSKRRWFMVGVAVGFAARQAVKTYIGI
jgi:hypothetical protein